MSAEKEAESGRQPLTGAWLRGFLHGRKLLFPAVFILLAIFFTSYRLWVSSYASSIPRTARSEAIIVYIPPESGFSAIKKILIDNNIINDDIRFRLLARRMGIIGKLQAGEYNFSPGLNNRAIIEKIAKGEFYYRPLTIPEGYNLTQIASLLENSFGYKSDNFLNQVNNPQYIKSVGLDVTSLEGYLFPDTYFITRGQKLTEIISMMVGRFHDIVAEISEQEKPFPSASSPIKTLHEMVILASIVEKETALPQERPLIASVFLNRLKKHMKLQADPTVIYGIPDFNGNITRKDLLTPSPYNTYTQTGLPAGPIANPGKASLLAVLHPADTDYLYFVAKNDGSHYFSNNLQEHNRAVMRFQKQRSTPATESALEKKQ